MACDQLSLPPLHFCLDSQSPSLAPGQFPCCCMSATASPAFLWASDHDLPRLIYYISLFLCFPFRVLSDAINQRWTRCTGGSDRAITAVSKLGMHVLIWTAVISGFPPSPLYLGHCFTLRCGWQPVQHRNFLCHAAKSNPLCCSDNLIKYDWDCEGHKMAGI